ncbi:MAG TPA: sensor histidine kinase [Candidatus Acidoferrales bacterium]|nr:sensor histidine kinase [Candidatus Acidoferrales bacterium]
MYLDSVERLYLERQISLGRIILVSLSLVVLLETSLPPVRRASATFLLVYLGIALADAVWDRFSSERRWRIPLIADFAALAAFLYLTPSVSAFWFLFLFAVFALATRGRERAVLAVVLGATAGVILRVAWADPFRWQSISHWLLIGFGTVASGLGMGFLGAREREHFNRQQFLEKITGLLQFDRGLSESIRQALGEVAVAFDCDQACLAIRDEDLERLFVWKVRPNERDPIAAETPPLTQSDAFLMDSLEVSMGWQFRNGNGTGSGFGWDRRSGQPFHALPPPPNAAREELKAQTLLAATIESGGRPAGRVLLVNPKHGLSAAGLRQLEQIVRHIGPPLENIFLLRNLRARAVESERSRISRDLHDGILQTLLSMNIQLDVLRRKLADIAPGPSAELAGLQKTLQQESQEFRRMVTDMRPLRVDSADMRELMLGFAERFRNESGIAIDLFIEDRNLRLPDRLCRELFQIYREALHNIKKHANASHVVVKLGQDEAKVFLVVDDNGRGFSFPGRYKSEELDRLRLGPISIKERTRSVGGTLTVESNPGHGARLTVEIPMN